MKYAVAMNEDQRPDRHLMFALLSFSLLTVIMQFGMISVSLREMTTDLDAPLRWSGWVLTIFMVGQVIAMPVAGRLADRFGARLVFAGGLAFFGGASVVCAFAPNVYLLIVARLVQGVAGGCIMPAGSSLIAEVYGRSRTRAIGFYSSLMPFGAVLGPVLGGIIVDHLGWRWTFGVNAPLALASCVLGFLILPAGRRAASQRIDFAGVGLIALTVVALVYALTELGQRAATPNYSLVLAAGITFVLSFSALVLHERRTPVPVVDLDLLHRRAFLSANALSFFFGMAWGSVVSLLPLYAQEAYQLTASKSGALLGPRSVAMVLTSSLAAFLLPRTGFRKPLLVGLLGTAATLALLAQGIHSPSFAGIHIASFWWLMIVIATAGVFFGCSNPSMNSAVLDLAPDRIAAVAGLRGMFQNIGSVLGVAGAVLVASRAGTTAGGLEMAFTFFAVLMAASTIFILGIPEMGSARPTSDVERPTAVAEPELAAAGMKD